MSKIRLRESPDPIPTAENICSEEPGMCKEEINNVAMMMALQINDIINNMIEEQHGKKNI